MKVKKLFALALSAVMVLGLAACGDSAANTSTVIPLPTQALLTQEQQLLTQEP